MTTALATAPTGEERGLALLGHALTFFEGGIVGPLILYLLKREESEFVAFHALQSLYFGLAWMVLGISTCGLLLLLLLPFYVGFEAYACMQANQGEWYRLPIVGNIAARTHPPPA